MKCWSELGEFTADSEYKNGLGTCYSPKMFFVVSLHSNVTYRKVSRCKVVALHYDTEHTGQVRNELRLLLFLAHQRRHLRLEVANDVCKGLDLANSFDQLYGTKEANEKCRERR